MCCENNCLKLSLKCCQDSLAIIAGLAATTAYNYIVTDSRGNKYTDEFTTDADGSFEILAEDLPDSLFSAETNKITIQVKKLLDDDTFVPMKITQSFECVEVNFTGTKESVGI